MKIERGMYSVTLEPADNREYFDWFNRNNVPQTRIGASYLGMMDSITVIRFKKYFDIPNIDSLVTQAEVARFEEFAQLNLPLDKDKNGIYVNDITFQAWQFYKLGRN